MSEEEVSSGAPSGRRQQAVPNLSATFARLEETMNTVKDACARMDMEAQRMSSLLAKLQWEMRVVPPVARTAYLQLQSTQGGVRTGGLLNINGRNTPVPRTGSCVAHRSRGSTRGAHGALRVAAAGAATFKRTANKTTGAGGHRSAAWLAAKDMADDGSRLGRIDGGSPVRGTPAASD